MSAYVIDNDDYLATGYVTSDYVGTDSDLYVEAGYVSGVVLGEASVSAVASLSVSGGNTPGGISVTCTSSATITVVGSKTTVTDCSISSSATVTPSAIKSGEASASLSSSASTTQSANFTASGVIDSNAAWTTVVSAVGIINESSAINSAFTTSTDAVKTAVGEVSIAAFQTHPTLWGDSITWDQNNDIIWGQMVQADADAFKNGIPGTISNSATLTADGDVTAIANISPAAVATVDVTGTFTVGAESSISSSATVNVTGVTNNDIRDLNISSAFSLTSSGIFQVEGRLPAISSSFTVTADADTIADGVVVKAGSFDVSTDFTRIRSTLFDETLSSAFTVDANGDNIAHGEVIKGGLFGVAVDGISNIVGSTTINSAFTTDFKGGILFGGIVNIQAFVTTVSALTIYNIDPFRVYPVDSETRSLNILQESRDYPVKSENRLNTIEEENRIFKVPSETRTIVIQPLTLVEVAGNPLDRRKG